TQGTAYSSGAYWVVRPTRARPDAYRINYRTGGSVSIDQKSWYVQDNWQITDNFMLYLGMRNDSFNNKNTDGVSFVKQDDIWQPRLGFSWDVTGDGRSKLFGSLGRYSLPVAANVSLRAASPSYYTVDYYDYLGSYDPVSGKPNVAAT
ncbi:TonB-dependent receptor domain-containing protein, partial [Stenotrophomonas maltophilia]